MIKRGSISLKFIVTGILVLLVALCMSAGLLLVSDKALAEGGTEAELIEIKSSNITTRWFIRARTTTCPRYAWVTTPRIPNSA